MNFLGHFYLSNHDQDLIVGNYIADFVKGKKFNKYPEGIANGIMLHRRIDHYTDRHQMVRNGRKRLFQEFRHYSGVIIDMFYDHYLARFWRNYSSESLESFAIGIYKIIEANWDLLPSQAKYMFPYMKNGNWLVRYASPEGIGQSLTGMSRRLNNNSKLEFAEKSLHEHYDEFKLEFETFIGDVKDNFRETL